ncbi:MAG: outer membrane beta-barrel protein [Prolixibacteraceae bacterium]
MKNILLLLIIFIGFNSFGEHPFGPSQNRNHLFYFELVGGGVMPAYSANTSSDLVANYNFGYQEGFAFRYQLMDRYSVSTQLSFLKHDVNYGVNKEYRLESSHLTLFVPLEVEWSLSSVRDKVSSTLSVFAGPYIINNMNGKFAHGKNVEQLDFADMPQWDYGVESGIGFRFPVFSANMRNNLTLKASYYRGMNTDFELPTGVSDEPANLKSALLAQSTSIRNNGIRFSVCYEFSLKKWEMSTFTAGGNGKTTYSRYVLK